MNPVHLDLLTSFLLRWILAPMQDLTESLCRPRPYRSLFSCCAPAPSASHLTEGLSILVSHLWFITEETNMRSLFGWLFEHDSSYLSSHALLEAMPCL